MYGNFADLDAEIAELRCTGQRLEGTRQAYDGKGALNDTAVLN